MITYKEETLKELIKYINGKNKNLDRAAILAIAVIAAGTICGIGFVQGISTAFTILGASINPEIKKSFEYFNKKSKENEVYANYKRCKFAESVLARLAVKNAVENMTQSKERFLSRWKISNTLREDKKQEIYEQDIQRENKYNKLFSDINEFKSDDYWDELIVVIEKVIEIKEEEVLEFRYAMKENIKDCYTAFKIQIQLESELFDKYNHIIESEKNIKEIEEILNNSLANMSSEILPLRGRVATKLNELNEEYKKAFSPISGKLLSRSEFEFCNDNIKDGKSIIIHGKAGIGKSGCTQSIVSFCEKNRIPFIAIKLDKRVPSGCAEKWGMDLGLPDSIAYTLNGIAKNENAVIILDQLDALRWTQSHSRDALIVCSEIIQQVNELNKARNKKMSMVLVCRTYDLENDNNIKSLFKNNGQRSGAEEWVKILLEELSDDTVRKIIGVTYDNLTKKLKAILKIPSNLYIWEKLDGEKIYDDISTTNELIYEWWRQLVIKCEENGITEKGIREAKENIVENLEKHGWLSINRRLLDVEENSLEYLVSNGFIMRSNKSISFTHQSILDYFLAEKMFQRYYDGENILRIIGSKKTQTPGKRYQIQMLLQFIQEDNQDDFIELGKIMLESPNVRFYVKYVFLEVLGQCTSINISIENFILEYCEKDGFENHIIDNVINRHSTFVELLLENRVLDKWMQNDKRKNVAINLIANLSPRYSGNAVAFIKRYVFVSKEDDEKLFRCFGFIQEDTDEMFKLRMEFYQHYPEMARTFINFKKMFQNCELRAISVFEFLLNYKAKRNDKNIYKYEEGFLDVNSEIMVKNGKVVLDKLLPYIPMEREYYSINSEWGSRYSYKISLERACVEIIKKANATVINENPETFIEIYKRFIGKGYIVFNEIILTGLEQIPNDFSNVIVSYIATNLNENVFDKTSGNVDELALVKAVLTKHTVSCSEDVFLSLENTIIAYIDPKAKEWYTRRIEYNKNKENGNTVYWSFWGDMQMALLACLPLNRMSVQSKGLLKVLNRRFGNVQARYIHSNDHGGGVRSSIEGKKLGNKQWLKILTNNKLNRKNSSELIEVIGGFIENSIEEFSRSFGDAASAEPERFIDLILCCDTDIPERYIDALFSAVAFSNQLNAVSTQLLEKMILKYRYNYDSIRAGYICNIIEEKENADWSQDIIDILNDIAINHFNSENGKPNVTSDKNKEMKSFDMLRSNALNCVRGTVARAIGNLLWSNKEQYAQFKETVSKLCNDMNPAVRLANLFALNPIYNIDKDWATEKILYTFERDYRMAGYSGARQLFVLMYPKFRERVLKIILKCFFSDDKELIKMGAYSLTEMYIRNGEFEDEIFDIENMNEIQVKSILEMALNFFNKYKFVDLVKSLINKYISSKFDLEFPLSRIFYDNFIDLERDRDLVIEIMKSNMSTRMTHYFVEYLEKNSKSIIEYNEIIISISYTIIQNYVEDSKHSWGIENELSKLIIELYDETSKLPDKNLKCSSQQCLNIWDLMFEKRIGSARVLSQQILDR